MGINSSPVAVALSEANLVNTAPEAVVLAAEEILEEVPVPAEVPEGEFWEWAFHDLPDQWLRLWFLGGGGRPEVAYGAEGQIRHSGPGEFAFQIL